jgi:hypothetical protein
MSLGEMATVDIVMFLIRNDQKEDREVDVQIGLVVTIKPHATMFFVQDVAI